MNNLNRRYFLKRITAFASAGFLSLQGIFSQRRDTDMKRSFVYNVEPLGFQWKANDPFLFCVHHEDFYPKGNEDMGPDPKELEGREMGQDFLLKDGWRMYHGQRVPGFPNHPHRGFETITVVRKGMVDHTDSMGASGRYGDGDVQWMTAGKGIQHAEMFPLINEDKENPMELFQIWLNLPSTRKFVEPHFKMLWADSIPKYLRKDGNGKKTVVEVIAGRIDKVVAPSPPPDSWASVMENDVAIWNIHMEAGAKWTLPKASPGINRKLYFYKGSQLNLSMVQLENYHSAELTPEVDIDLEAGDEECRILILQGKPIRESVVQHGPFVMNTREEIMKTFEDYQKTQFGGWPWQESGPVHPKSQGRFAKHANGKTENKF